MTACQCPCHTRGMRNEQTHPYTLEVYAAKKPGHFQWLIRKHGKLFQRTDKLHPSESDARQKGQIELDRVFIGDRRTR
jgi:hypothetical protein